MKQILLVLWLFYIVDLSFGQNTIQYAESNGLTIKLPSDWVVVQENDKDQFDNLYYLIIEKKTNDKHAWNSITILINTNSNQYFNNVSKYQQTFEIDTITLCNYKTIRVFYQYESFPIIEIGNDSIVDKPFHIEWFVKLNDKKFINISGDYSSTNVQQVEQFKTELLTFIESIKIK